CGIEKTCEATFTVLEKDDLEIITEAQPLTVSCESDPQTAFQQWLTNNGNAKATSTCDIVWSNNYSEELWDNTCENSKNITVTFTAFNGCGELETTAMFSIEDTTAPVLSDTPEDIIVACDNIPDPVILTAIDNCDDTVSVEFEEKSTTDGCKSTLERIWKATDCAGNSTTHTQIITIEDKQEPSFVETLPVDQVVSCDNIPDPVILTAIDNCDDTVSAEFEEKTTTDGCSSTLQRIWTATDCAGNITNHTQIITIEDKQAPVLAATSIGYLENISVSCGEIPEPPILAFEDNCTLDLSIHYSEIDSAMDPDGGYQITRLWKVS